jgi:mannose-6-phosphate isomerase-like protein (cupin superfamily)
LIWAAAAAPAAAAATWAAGSLTLPATHTPGTSVRPLASEGTYSPTPEGYEWLYVLNGRLRLVLGAQDLVLSPGEAAEFDTRVPHWFGAADAEPIEFLSLFGRQGERAHLRARPKTRNSPG